MFIFTLHNILVDQKLCLNRKSEELSLEELGKNTHLRMQKLMLHKRLFFISKKLQLIHRITISRVVPYISETSGKKREKRRGKV